MPDIVLIGQGDKLEFERHTRQAVFEVAVVAAVGRLAKKAETVIVTQNRADRGEAFGFGVVIGDEANPVALRLRSQRGDLPREQVAGRIVRCHANGDVRRRGNLVRAWLWIWNWKVAALSALLRSNRRGGDELEHAQ